MARLRRKGATATRLVRDDDNVPMPIMPWGFTHNLMPNESTAARNATPISDSCGVISVIAIGGGAHFRQGDATVTATTSDPFLPAGIWHELPVFEGSGSSHVSFIAATGAGSITTQICERQ